MSAAKDDNPRNDKVTKACQGLGYCCPYAFFEAHKGKHDTQKKLGKMLNLSFKAVQYNQKRIREGTLTCAKAPDCQKD